MSLGGKVNVVTLLEHQVFTHMGQFAARAVPAKIVEQFKLCRREGVTQNRRCVLQMRVIDVGSVC